MFVKEKCTKEATIARIHEEWTVEDWKRVVFSHETKINRFNADGRTWCWVNDQKIFPDRAVKQTVKHGGGTSRKFCVRINKKNVVTVVT